jgi:hypothetical protein
MEIDEKPAAGVVEWSNADMTAVIPFRRSIM